jgi:acyl-CoA thioesterase
MTDKPTFSALLDSINPASESPSITIPLTWGQGRATFGGLVAAAAVRVLRGEAGKRPLRSLQVMFSEAVRPGVCEVEARIIREGKMSATTTEAAVLQDGGIPCSVLATFAARRGSAVVVPGPPRPEAPPPEDAREMPYIEGVVPTFMQHLEYRFTQGGFPFSGTDASAEAGWIRFRNPQTAAPEEIVLALVDAWPPPVIQMLDEAAPSVSINWQLDLADVPKDVDAQGWWFFESHAVHADGGYAQIRSTLWTPDGDFVAASSQTFAVFV